MDVITTHARIASRPDFGRSLLPEDIEIDAANGLEPYAVLATAGVRLSGMMEDAETDADLDEAADHCRTLLNAGVVTFEQWTDEADQVMRDFVAWGDEMGLEP